MAPMLHVYYGTDSNRVRADAFAELTAAEDAGARVTRIDSDTYEAGMLENALGAASLFGETECYLVDSPQSVAELAEEVAACTPGMGESVNTFILIEGALNAAERKSYEAHATRVEERKAPAAERFNPFGMADALARRDKRALWTQLQQARQAGLVEEEIIGTLWWQLKTLQLAAITRSAEEAGIKEYPYKKAKTALRSWQPEQLTATATALVSLYHAGHAGERPLDLALEQWVLTL